MRTAKKIIIERHILKQYDQNKKEYHIIKKKTKKKKKSFIGQITFMTVLASFFNKKKTKYPEISMYQDSQYTLSTLMLCVKRLVLTKES